MRASLDLHDFSILNNKLDILLLIKEHLPNFKVSLFAIPFDLIPETSVSGRVIRARELEKIKDNLDWLQIIPHGMMHAPREFERADRETMELYLKAVDGVFNKDGLPYEKGFCAPYWLWNQEVIDVLNENGWWGAVDRNQPDMLRPKRFYQYTHSLEEHFWDSQSEVLNLHGHMDLPSANALTETYLNLLKLPSDTEFSFVTDFICES